MGETSSIQARSVAALVGFFLTFQPCHGFFIPGIAPHTFLEGEAVSFQSPVLNPRSFAKKHVLNIDRMTFVAVVYLISLF
jgi:hypothetical protein